MGITIKSRARFDTKALMSRVRDKAAAKALADAKEKLRLLRCPEHGKPAEVTMEETGTATFKLNISGCCTQFRQEARRIISRK